MVSPVLQTALDEMFGQLATQNNPTPVVEAAQAVTAPIAAPVVESTPATPVASAPVVTPVATPPIDLDAVVDSWDSDAPVEPAAQVQSAAVIAPLSELAKVLNVQKEDEVLKAVEAYKQKADSLEKLPPDLSKALEIASNGGNYLEYLNIGVIDWSKEDPITLYENYVTDQFTDASGQVDAEKLDNLLDSIHDNEKELRGRELQRQYVNYQSQRKAMIENEARQNKQRFEQSLRSAVDSLDNIAGFKLTQSHKAELYNYVLSGQDLKPADLQARVIDAGLKKYWGKMDNFRKTQIKNATQRELLEATTFPRLNSTSAPAAPDAPKKTYDAMDYIKELEKQRGFAPSS